MRETVFGSILGLAIVAGLFVVAASARIALKDPIEATLFENSRRARCAARCARLSDAGAVCIDDRCICSKPGETLEIVQRYP